MAPCIAYRLSTYPLPQPTSRTRWPANAPYSCKRCGELRRLSFARGGVVVHEVLRRAERVRHRPGGHGVGFPEPPNGPEIGCDTLTTRHLLEDGDAAWHVDARRPRRHRSGWACRRVALEVVDGSTIRSGVGADDGVPPGRHRLDPLSFVAQRDARHAQPSRLPSAVRRSRSAPGARRCCKRDHVEISERRRSGARSAPGRIRARASALRVRGWTGNSTTARRSHSARATMPRQPLGIVGVLGAVQRDQRVAPCRLHRARRATPNVREPRPQSERTPRP